MSFAELFWTYWLPHYISIIWKVVFTIWLLLSPIMLLLLRWPRYAAGSRRWLRGLNGMLAASSLLCLLCSAVEFASAWYSQVVFKQFAFINRYTGSYWWANWRFEFLMLAAQLLWVRRGRSSWALTMLLLLSWLGSSFVLAWQFAHNDYLLSSWPIAHWLPYFMP